MGVLIDLSEFGSLYSKNIPDLFNLEKYHLKFNRSGL
jgi:hypothetical protein